MIRAEDDTRTLEGYDPSFGPSGGYVPGSFQGGPDMNAGRDAIAQAMLAQQGMQPPQGGGGAGQQFASLGGGGGMGGGGANPLGSFQGGPDMNDPANAWMASGGDVSYGRWNPHVGSSLSGGMPGGTGNFGGFGPGNPGFDAAAAAANQGGSTMFGSGSPNQGSFNTGETGRGSGFGMGAGGQPSIGNFGASFSGPGSFATANNTPGAQLTSPSESFAGRWGGFPSNTLPDPNDPAIHGTPAQTARSAPTAPPGGPPPGGWPSGNTPQQGPNLNDPGDQAAMAAAQGFGGGDMVGGYDFGSGFNSPGAGSFGGGGWGGFDAAGNSGFGGFSSGDFGSSGVG